MSLTLDQVRHVALLARLALTEEELQQYQKQLSAILDAVATLDELDTSNVEPTSHATMAQAFFREDAVLPSLPPEKGLSNAPAKVGSSFAVPKIIE
jgi:aspartyl-tRNA(Asn)/glutamyl-tRNA(Gln) amidotransferase subunit C